MRSAWQVLMLPLPLLDDTNHCVTACMCVCVCVRARARASTCGCASCEGGYVRAHTHTHTHTHTRTHAHAHAHTHTSHPPCQALGQVVYHERYFSFHRLVSSRGCGAAFTPRRRPPHASVRLLSRGRAFCFVSWTRQDAMSPPVNMAYEMQAHGAGNDRHARCLSADCTSLHTLSVHTHIPAFQCARWHAGPQ